MLYSLKKKIVFFSFFILLNIQLFHSLSISFLNLFLFLSSLFLSSNIQLFPSLSISFLNLFLFLSSLFLSSKSICDY